MKKKVKRVSNIKDWSIEILILVTEIFAAAGFAEAYRMTQQIRWLIFCIIVAISTAISSVIITIKEKDDGIQEPDKQQCRKSDKD